MLIGAKYLDLVKLLIQIRPAHLLLLQQHLQVAGYIVSQSLFLKLDVSFSAFTLFVNWSGDLVLVGLLITSSYSGTDWKHC